MKDLSEDNGINWLLLEGIPTLIRYPVQWRQQRKLPERGASREIPVLEDKLDGTRWCGLGKRKLSLGDSPVGYCLWGWLGNREHGGENIHY